jgi:hypothetical protein
MEADREKYREKRDQSKVIWDINWEVLSRL